MLDPHHVRGLSAGGAGAVEARVGSPRIVSLIVARGIEDVSQPLSALFFGLVVVGGLMLASGAAAVELAVRWGLRPVLDLSQKVAAIEASTLGTRVSSEPAVAELRPIERTLNDVLTRLQAAFERQGRFTSSAAHELRGPLAEICALCEVALRQPRETTATEKALEETLVVARQMEHMVGVLLAIARADGEQSPALLEEPVALAPLVQDVWRPLAGRAADKGIECSFEIADRITVRTDRALLRVLLSNLVDNAVEYTPPGGRIRLCCAARDASLTITVANTSLLRDRNLLSNMFEPFWRLDPTGGSTAHSGLGLSLARNLAGSLRGVLDAELSEEGELSLTLRLPSDLAPPRDARAVAPPRA